MTLVFSMARLLFFFFSIFLTGYHALGSDTTVQRQLFFRGPEYTKIVAVSSGSPYLYEDSPGVRKVHYYGQWFEGVELHYDAEDDLLMTREMKGAIRMSLVKEKVTAFSLGSRKFLSVPLVGFCEVFHNGRHTVLVKWQKVLVRQGAQEPFYRTYQKVFISQNGTLSIIENRKDLMKLVSEKNVKTASEYLRKIAGELKKDFPAGVARFMDFVDLNKLYD